MDIETIEAGIVQAIARIQTALQTLSAAIDGKVDAVAGMGLSTNDFTDEDKARIDVLWNKKHGLSPGDIYDAGRFTRIELE